MKLYQNKNAANFLGAVVVLLGVMFAVIIASMVMFAFIDAGDVATTATETYSVTGVNGTTFYFPLSHTPASSPGWNISTTGTAGTFYLAAANYTYITANNTVSADAIGKYNTSASFIFNTIAYDTVGNVNTYAVVVFGMLALVPLIIVGALMLRSLGFFGGGKQV